MSKFIIRKAKITDSINIHKCGKRNLPLYYTYNEINNMINSDNHIIFVSIINNIIIGYIISKITDKNIHILSIGVDEYYRRQSIGTDFIKSLEKYVTKKLDIETMSLYVHLDNLNSQQFYKKNNFVIIDQLYNYYGGGLKNTHTQDAYHMKKNL